MIGPSLVSGGWAPAHMGWQPWAKLIGCTAVLCRGVAHRCAAQRQGGALVRWQGSEVWCNSRDESVVSCASRADSVVGASLVSGGWAPAHMEWQLWAKLIGCTAVLCRGVAHRCAAQRQGGALVRWQGSEVWCNSRDESVVSCASRADSVVGASLVVGGWAPAYMEWQPWAKLIGCTAVLCRGAAHRYAAQLRGDRGPQPSSICLRHRLTGRVRGFRL